MIAVQIQESEESSKLPTDMFAVIDFSFWSNLHEIGFLNSNQEHTHQVH